MTPPTTSSSTSILTSHMSFTPQSSNNNIPSPFAPSTPDSEAEINLFTYLPSPAKRLSNIAARFPPALDLANHLKRSSPSSSPIPPLSGDRLSATILSDTDIPTPPASATYSTYTASTPTAAAALEALINQFPLPERADLHRNLAVSVTDIEAYQHAYEGLNGERRSTLYNTAAWGRSGPQESIVLRSLSAKAGPKEGNNLARGYDDLLSVTTSPITGSTFTNEVQSAEGGNNIPYQNIRRRE